MSDDLVDVPTKKEIDIYQEFLGELVGFLAYECSDHYGISYRILEKTHKGCDEYGLKCQLLEKIYGERFSEPVEVEFFLNGELRTTEVFAGMGCGIYLEMKDGNWENITKQGPSMFSNRYFWMVVAPTLWGKRCN